MKKNIKTQYQYKVIVSNYPKESNTSEYIINGDDIVYAEFDEGQSQFSISLNKKTVFSCHMSRVIECYREDVIIDHINNETNRELSQKERILEERKKKNNLILLNKDKTNA